MRQPKVVKILDCSEKRLYKLPDTPVKCKLQDREVDDDSKIVYVNNPWYNTENSEAETELLAFTHTEYEVVEWTKK